MHLVIFGASGRTGNHLVRQAIGMGHDVTAFVRRSNKLSFSHERLRVIVGDARDRFNVDRAIHGAEAVITAIAPDLNDDEDTLPAIANVIFQSMKKHNVTRFVAMSDSHVVLRPHLNVSVGQRVSQLFTLPSTARWLRISQKYVTAISANQSLQWSIVRTHQLYDGNYTGEYIVDTQNNKLNVSIKRANAADFMLRIASNGKHINEMPIISDK